MTDTSTTGGKALIESKTFWVNIVGLAAIVAQTAFGFVISPEWQAGALTLINMVLRLVTKENIASFL